MEEFFLSGASGGIIGVLCYRWLHMRLQASIKHEYDEKLEKVKADLVNINQKDIFSAETQAGREASLLGFAYSAFSTGQKAAIEKQLNAIDALWHSVLTLRNSMPSLTVFLDILTEEEYGTLKSHKDFQLLAKGVSDQDILGLFDKDIEQARPYVGEYLWALFYSYRAINLRILTLIRFSQKDADKINWHRDSGILQLSKAVLSEEEFTAFQKKNFGKFSHLQNLIEQKILILMQKMISGEHLSLSSLDKAKEILAAAKTSEEKLS